MKKWFLRSLYLHFYLYCVILYVYSLWVSYRLVEKYCRMLRNRAYTLYLWANTCVSNNLYFWVAVVKATILLMARIPYWRSRISWESVFENSIIFYWKECKNAEKWCVWRLCQNKDHDCLKKIIRINP